MNLTYSWTEVAAVAAVTSEDHEVADVAFGADPGLPGTARTSEHPSGSKPLGPLLGSGSLRLAQLGPGRIPS